MGDIVYPMSVDGQAHGGLTQGAAGAVGAAPALINASTDALGMSEIQTPATPERAANKKA